MKLFLKIFLILLVAVAGYTALMSYSPILKGIIDVVTEKNTGNVVSAKTKDYPFVFYKALPWWYSVASCELEFSLTVNVNIAIPALSELDHDSFALVIPIQADVQIIPEKLKNLNILKDSLVHMKESFGKELEQSFSTHMQDFLVPVYQYAQILENKDKILATVTKDIDAKYKDEGILISNLQHAGLLQLPDARLYEEGLIFLNSQRRILHENKKKMMELSGQLERDALEKEKLFKSYSDVSVIIKENPNILKYIYIDKMAPNLKVIVSSDKTALPAFLEDQEKKDSVDNSEKNTVADIQP